jgi:aryl-alcohol dehydrogenase-like predicted oxidoreductase
VDAATTTEQITIGQSGIVTAPLGVGTWAWGDSRLWGYGQGYGREDLAGAFAASVAAGVTLFDTAEIYGRGESERILGELVRATNAPITVATKFAPYPWRFSARTLRGALDASLRRLGLARVDLYQIHFPYTILSIPALMDALADAVAEGKVRAVGVSNYSAPQMQRAHEVLARRGVPLASNQVQYSLLWRQPERNGVLATCQALGVTLIAYSPLAQGRLTGTYGPGHRPSDWRRWQPDFSEANLRRNAGLLDLLRGIGQDHGGKTPAQVALNWLIHQAGVLPIPGAKTAAQAVGNAGTLGWALTPAEITALRAASPR